MFSSLWSDPGPAPTNAISRRTLLRLGGLTAIGASAGWPYRARAQAAAAAPAVPRKARACILLYLLGGPPPLDMWDLKTAPPPAIPGPVPPAARPLPGPHTS